MSDKDWDEMSLDEKVENLNSRLKHLIGHINQNVWAANDDRKRTLVRLQSTEETIKELARDMATLRPQPDAA